MGSRASILPSLLTHDEETFQNRLHLCEGNVETVHIDIADGRFVHNTSWADPARIASWNSALRFELHLMVNDPHEEIAKWENVQNVSRIIVHVESPAMDTREILATAQKNNWHVGVGFQLDSDPLSYKSVIQALQPTHALCMGIHRIGFSGQALDATALAQQRAYIKESYEQSAHWQWIVDGGVKADNLKKLSQLGFNEFVLASEIFDAANPKQRIEELQALVS